LAFDRIELIAVVFFKLVRKFWRGLESWKCWNAWKYVMSYSLRPDTTLDFQIRLDNLTQIYPHSLEIAYRATVFCNLSVNIVFLNKIPSTTDGTIHQHTAPNISLFITHFLTCCGQWFI